MNKIKNRIYNNYFYKVSVFLPTFVKYLRLYWIFRTIFSF